MNALLILIPMLLVLSGVCIVAGLSDEGADAREDGQDPHPVYISSDFG